MNIESTNKNLSLLFTMLMAPISIILLIISVYLIQPKVEASLVLNVTSALKEHNIEAEVSFSGRDGILKGEVDSQDVVEKAQRISGAVFGIRIIRNHLSIRSKKYNVEKINSFIQRPVIRKISNDNTVQIPKKSINNSFNEAMRLLLKNKKNPLLIPEVDRIIANMGEKVLPTTYNNATDDIFKPIESNKIIQPDKIKENVLISPDIIKTVKRKEKSEISVKKPNELFIIINDFNSSMAYKKSGATSYPIKKEKLNNASSSLQRLEEMDLSTLYFSNNSTILSKDMHQILNKISASIKAYSHSYIELITYGNDSDLAYAQGVAIREYLVTTGIRKNIIHVAGHTVTAKTIKKANIKIFAR
jgi:hypothetical protein